MCVEWNETSRDNNNMTPIGERGERIVVGYGKYYLRGLPGGYGWGGYVYIDAL